MKIVIEALVVCLKFFAINTLLYIGLDLYLSVLLCIREKREKDHDI